jgi:hypothetical protein
MLLITLVKKAANLVAIDITNAKSTFLEASSEELPVDANNSELTPP